ncbi:hypothetical protein N0V90_012369 [Kalmusia sp. IMI 367209]|nr:hypothetical protein N0V90_012369 [Kalmusia sp. IMI 367209]
MGGSGLVVGKGGSLVVLKTGGEGLTVGRLSVGRLGVGIGGIDIDENEGIGLEEKDGSGLDVGKGGNLVLLETGGEGLSVGMLREGRLKEGRLKEGRLKDGRLNVGRLSVGRGGRGRDVESEGGDGLTVGRVNVGNLVELNTGGEGLTVGRVNVGNPVELKTGGGGLTVGRVKVGIGEVDDTDRENVVRKVELTPGMVGMIVGMLRDGRDKLVGSIGEIDGTSVREAFTLGSGSVDDGRMVGRDNDGRDSDGRDNDGRDNDGKDSDGNDNDGSDNDGSDNDGSDNDGSDTVVGLVRVPLELETLTLGTGGRVGNTVGRELRVGTGIDSDGIDREPVGTGGMLKLIDAEVEGKLTVEGRGIPEGRVHVTFCAVAKPARANSVSETSTSMTAGCTSQEAQDGIRAYHTCFTDVQL